MLSFMHTSPPPADYAEPTAPPSSPLTSPISPEQDACEKRLQRWKHERSISYSPPMFPNLAAQEAALGLPSMIPEEKDMLCIRPGNKRRAKFETIRPGDETMYRSSWQPGADLLSGRESVRRQLHVLSLSGRDPEKVPHRVGVDAPWAPDELTPLDVWEAHREYAVKWQAEANTFTLPPEEEGGKEMVRNDSALGATTSDTREPAPSGEETLGEEQQPPQLKPGDIHWDGDRPLRCILATDVGKPYPVGARPGEEYIAIDPPPLERGSARFPSNRPARPVGVYDPAERLYYAQMERRRWMEDVVAHHDWRTEAAQEAAARVSHRGKSWEELERECEAAEMVLRVEGKMEPAEEWLPAPAPAPKAPRKKASPRGKGKGKKEVRSPGGDAGAVEQESGETWTQDPETLAAKTAAAGEAVAASIEADSAERGSPSPSPTYRGKRTRKPTAKAAENGAASVTPTPTPSLSSGEGASEAEEEEPPPPPLKRQRRSSRELMPPPPPKARVVDGR